MIGDLSVIDGRLDTADAPVWRVEVRGTGDHRDADSWRVLRHRSVTEGVRLSGWRTELIVRFSVCAPDLASATTAAHDRFADFGVTLGLQDVDLTHLEIDRVTPPEALTSCVDRNRPTPRPLVAAALAEAFAS